jgi:hypothetical protein
VVSVECPHGGRVGKWESGLLLDPAAVAVECDVPRQDSAIGVPFSARHQLGIASPFSGFALRPSAAASGSRCEKLVRAWENEIVGERKWKNPLVKAPMRSRSSSFVLIFAFCSR